MNRSTMTLIVVCLVLSGVLGMHAYGTEATQVTAEAHQIVGTWGPGGAESIQLITFYADGNALLTDGAGGIFQGAWEPVDENFVNTKFIMVPRNSGVVGAGAEGPMLVTDDGRLYADSSNEPYYRVTPNPEFANDIDLDDPAIQDLLTPPAGS